MFFSSGLSGAVYIAAFFFKGGEIARSIISEYFRRISEGTGKVSAINLFRISDTAYGIGVFFIGAWLISFIINIQRYSRFSVSIDSRCMKLSYGAVTQRNYRIISSYINFVDLRQNLIMKLSGAITVHISCPGYGAGHRSLPVLLPGYRYWERSDRHSGADVLPGYPDPPSSQKGVPCGYLTTNTGYRHPP